MAFRKVSSRSSVRDKGDFLVRMGHKEALEEDYYQIHRTLTLEFDLSATTTGFSFSVLTWFRDLCGVFLPLVLLQPFYSL